MVVPEEKANIEHCEFCDVCVVELDHHCPWSSKCIGKGNDLAFKSFLFALVLQFLYMFGTIAYVAGK